MVLDLVPEIDIEESNFVAPGLEVVKAELHWSGLKINAGGDSFFKKFSFAQPVWLNGRD